MALALAACGGPPAPMLATDVPSRLPDAYDDALTAWTRGAEQYEAFVGRLFVRATLFSPAFAAVYAEHLAARLGLTDADAAARRQALVQAASTETRFLVALNTQDARWNDLGGPEATLRAALRQDGVEIPPTSVQEVGGEEQADLVPFFPHLGPLTTVYWVTFPPAPDPKRIRLRIAGPPAVVDLEWEDR